MDCKNSDEIARDSLICVIICCSKHNLQGVIVKKWSYLITYTYTGLYDLWKCKLDIKVIYSIDDYHFYTRNQLQKS